MADYSEILHRIKTIYSSMDSEEQFLLKAILEEISLYGESKTYEELWLSDYKEIPVDKHTFLTDSRYLGQSNDNGKAIYPRWMEVMEELESTGNQYYEIVFTGATRTGKTSTAVSDACYQLYRMMCLRDPQKYFGLKSVTTISFFFFNLTATLARGVAYREFNSTLSVSPWFQEHGKMNQSTAHPTYIPEGNLIAIEYGSDAAHALGKATACVVFDEVNFSQAGIKDIEKSKARMKAKYDTLVARVTGTFVKNGEVFGKLYVISSKNSDSDFMEEYIQKQKAAGNKHMYVFDEPQWKVWPKSKYSSDKMFYIALGGKKLRSFVVPDNETEEGLAELKEQGYRLMEVPEDNKTRFLSDFDIALRDIAGVSVPGTLSFITQDALNQCIGTRKNPFYNEVVQIGTKDTYSLEEFFHIEAVPDNIRRAPLFIHLDLSLNTDRTGISGVAITGRKDIKSGDKVISNPVFTHVFSVALEAPNGDKIPYDKITSFLCWLRRSKFNIVTITRDQFQSEYMAQLLESQGFGEVKKLSLDRTPDGYMALRSVLLEHRIDMLDCRELQDELIHLQRDATTGKLDHPMGGCFTGDTKIALVDGRHITIHDLILEQTYKTNWVYTMNEETLRIEPKKILSAHQTKLVSDLLKITLDNGEVIECTLDHLFMLRDGSYLQAQDLEVGTSLMPLYTKLSEKGLVGYRLYYEPFADCWHFEHRQFCDFQKLGKGYVVHHQNYDKLDNCPTNLKYMSTSEHRILHNNQTLDYQKTGAGVKKWHQNNKHTQSYLVRNAKISKAVRKHNAEVHPEYAVHQQEEHDRILEIEEIFDVKWDRLTAAEKISYGVKFSRLKDPSIIEKFSRSMSKRHSEGKFKHAEAAISGRIWYTNGRENIYIKKNEVPPFGYYRGRTISKEHALAVQRGRQNMSEVTRKQLSETLSQDTSNRIWVTDGRIDKYICKTNEIPAGFHRGRSKVGKSHKVSSIQVIHKLCRVYDLTIEDNPNFALSAGVFVHNSKDEADSFAGATWSAILDDTPIAIPSKSVVSAMRAVNTVNRKPKNALSSIFIDSRYKR